MSLSPERFPGQARSIRIADLDEQLRRIKEEARRIYGNFADLFQRIESVRSTRDVAEMEAAVRDLTHLVDREPEIIDLDNALMALKADIVRRFGRKALELHRLNGARHSADAEEMRRTLDWLRGRLSPAAPAPTSTNSSKPPLDPPQGKVKVVQPRPAPPASAFAGRGVVPIGSGVRPSLIGRCGHPAMASDDVCYRCKPR